MPQCGSTFGDARCRLAKGHGRKHRDDKEWFITWTDEGRARVKQERCEERAAARKTGRLERPHPEWPLKQATTPHVI
jgi:hypothetical protein